MNRQSWQQTLSRPQMWAALARAAAAVMELILISLWYQGLFASARLTWPALFGLLAGVGVLSCVLIKAMEASGAGLLVRQGIFFAWAALASLGTLKVMVFAGASIRFSEMISRIIQFVTLKGSEGAAFLHLLVILLVIWQAASLARQQISVQRIQVNFQVGLLILLIYGIALAFRHPREAVTGLFLYLFFALVGMTAARVASLAEERGGRVPRLSAGWLAGIALTGLGTVGLAVLTGWLASGRVMAVIIKILVLIFTLITTLLLWVLTPVLNFLARAAAGLADLLQRLPKQAGGIRLPKLLEDLAVEINNLAGLALPGVVAGRAVLLAALLILFLLAALAGLRFHTRQANIDEEGSSAGSGREDHPWRRIMQRLLPSAKPRLRSAGQWFAAARIRRIYRQLMALSQKLGAGRPPSLTPLEFLPRLEELFPTEQESLGLITSAYVKVRYGEYPETLQEVEEVQRAWHRIRRQARRKSQDSASVSTAR